MNLSDTRVHLPTVKGLAFTRLAVAMALSGDKLAQAEKIAATRWGENSPPVRILKAGGPDLLLQEKANVSAGATATGNWAEELTLFEGAAAEFFALVREKSLLGRIPGLRRVPLRIRMISAATGVTAAWVGEGLAIPVSNASYDEGNLEPRKVAALCVVTEELARSSDPSAELVIRNDMIAAIAAAIDLTFIDPTNSGTPGVKPASVTNGAPSIASSGDGAADIRELIAGFPGDLERAVLIGSPATFAVLSDPFLLPGLGVRGGQALGIPAIPSTAAGSTLALIDPDGIAVAEGDMDLRTSREAVVEMKSDPAGSAITPTGAQTVSLWQTDSVGILAHKIVNWEVARPSVQTVTGVAAS